MASFKPRPRLVVDSIHGDIHLTRREWKIVDTASFQRLRQIKQIGMGHFTYPNATHTRFAHSLGVLGIMQRVLAAARHAGVALGREDRDNLRLAALLHDVGHYPYSHVMETIDSVKLAEEMVASAGTGRRPLDIGIPPYPDHEAVGRLIVMRQPDIVRAMGGEDRCGAVADLFTRSRAANAQLSKLIHSSLDMDRLDYLLRDSRAAGVPYGAIDINYILNNLRVSSGGLIGVSRKALPAAEQFLMARHFMHRAVYYHKTTVALEEACRQLLRRLRDRGAGHYEIPANGDEVERLVASDKLFALNDAFIDRLVARASEDKEPVVHALASSIHRRRPPRLLKEVCALVATGERSAEVTAFRSNCRHRLGKLAEDFGLDPRLFLFWEAKPIKFEERGATVAAAAARRLPGEEEEEAIRVFLEEQGEPQAIMDVDHSVMKLCAGQLFYIVRLYVVWQAADRNKAKLEELRREVREWDSGE